MSKMLIAGSAIVALLGATYAGYRIGTGKAAESHASHIASAATTGGAPASRAVLYWKDPDGKADFSPTEKKTADGRDYLPVHEDEEAGFAGTQPTKPKGSGRILYYRNPMGLPDTSPVPKKDWMGMDYIAVREGEEETGSTVKVSLDKIQRSGVRTSPVEMRRLDRPVRAPAVAKPDERTLYTVALRADGFIEKLYVNETGRHVKQGEPLFRLYSPDMVKVQVDYLNAIATAAPQSSRTGALQRLKNMALPVSVIDEINTSRSPVISFDWPSPVSGVVMQKKAIEGMMMEAGEEILRFADLSRIWVIADVAEQDVGQVRIGSRAKVSFRAFPGETFEGRVTFVLHELEMATRTGKVRIEVANPDHRIKHEMFADVEIIASDGERERLVVPASALIDSGNRQVVIVDRGEGRFEPRTVKVGIRGDGFVEITEGITAGESVVSAATFLIDAESNLRAALQAFTAEPAAKPEAKP